MDTFWTLERKRACGGRPQALDFFGAPGEIRTPDLLIRSQTLYPAELQAHGVGRGGSPRGSAMKLPTRPSAVKGRGASGAGGRPPGPRAAPEKRPGPNPATFRCFGLISGVENSRSSPLDSPDAPRPGRGFRARSGEPMRPDPGPNSYSRARREPAPAPTRFRRIGPR